MSDSNKRRRVSEDQSQPEVIPSMVGSAGIPPVDLVSKQAWEDIPEILLVKMQKDNPDEVADALGKLSDLMDFDDDDDCENTKAALRLGAPALVILQMKKYQYNKTVQLYGCSCLIHLSYLSSNEKTIVQLGGMEVAINAVKIFAGASPVQRLGLGTLMNLFDAVEEENDIVKDAIKQFVNDLNGLHLVLAAMNKFFDDEEIVQCCCGIFESVAEIKELHAPLKAAGVMAAFGKVLDRYSDNKDISKHGKGFMEEMVKDF